MQINQDPQGVARVDLAEAKRAFDRRVALFVDLRTKDRFDESHVPGAVSMPLPELASRMDELPHDRAIILY